MKTLRPVLALVPFFGTALFAQEPLAGETMPGSAAAYATMAPRLTPEQLEQLLGPIALYPDPLIALILPAAASPSDIVLAGRFLQSGADPALAEAQPWDESVRALAHYPDVVRWMDQNLAWTKQLGEAFVEQPAEVMNAVQRLRAQARAAGTLVDTPQQQIVAQDNTIFIEPAQPDVIYVPYYDPQVVYRTPGFGYYSGSFFSFSAGYATGFWLSHGVDWRERRVWVINHEERERYWREHRDWRDRTPGFNSPRNGYANFAPPPVHVWHPPTDQNRPHSSAPRGPSQVVPPSRATVVQSNGTPTDYAPPASGAPNSARRPPDGQRNWGASPNPVVTNPAPANSAGRDGTFRQRGGVPVANVPPSAAPGPNAMPAPLPTASMPPPAPRIYRDNEAARRGAYEERAPIYPTPNVSANPPAPAPVYQQNPALAVPAPAPIVHRGTPHVPPPAPVVAPNVPVATPAPVPAQTAPAPQTPPQNQPRDERRDERGGRRPTET